MAEVTLGNLYDFNKAAYAKISPLDPIIFHNKVKDMVHDIANQNKPYWMLLNNERKDYTVFIILTEEGTLNEMKPTLTNRGAILDIDKQEDGNYEIWIRDLETEENFVYYLFDYEWGIIQA